jgi:RNA polymerase sigma-70 factor (ECF subfamily)
MPETELREKHVKRAETPCPPAADRDLLARYRAGDVEAFETILSRYESPLLRFVSRYAPHAAQDLVQEVFLRLVRESESVRDVDNLSAWLYRVARNLAIDESRKEERRMKRHQLVALPERQAPASPAAERRETAELVSAKLMALPEKQRDVLILKIQEEKSYREISEVTGLTTSYVGYLIHQGLKTLARELRAAGVV